MENDCPVWYSRKKEAGIMREECDDVILPDVSVLGVEQVSVTGKYKTHARDRIGKRDSERTRRMGDGVILPQ